jgi:hypothetical protein
MEQKGDASLVWNTPAPAACETRGLVKSGCGKRENRNSKLVRLAATRNRTLPLVTSEPVVKALARTWPGRPLLRTGRLLPASITAGALRPIVAHVLSVVRRRRLTSGAGEVAGLTRELAGYRCDQYAYSTVVYMGMGNCTTYRHTAGSTPSASGGIQALEHFGG